MNGIEIPIGGDLAPFLAVVASLRGEIQALNASVRSSMQKAKSDFKTAGDAVQGVSKNTKDSAAVFRVMQRSMASIPAAARLMGNVTTGVLRSISANVRATTGMISGLGRGLRSMIPGASVLGPLAGAAGVLGGAALLTSQLKSGFDVAGEMERTKVAMEALTGSGDTARAMLNDMRESWVKTGVTVAQQAGSIQKFLALGFAPKDASKLQKNILDVAGAVGLTTSEAELLGSALSQVKAKGVVSMEELRQQIAEKGIPVFEALAAKLGVTQQELIKLVGDGQVPASALLDIFMNMEGTFGKFVGGASRMGMTFLGMLARVRGAWDLLVSDFAAPIADALKPILSEAITLIQSFKEQAVEAGKFVGNALLSAFALIKSGNTFALLKAGFSVAVTGAMDLLMRGLESAIAFLVNALPPVFEAATSKLRDPNFWSGMQMQFNALGVTLVAALREAVGDQQTADAMRQIAEITARRGGEQISKSGMLDSGLMMKLGFSRGQAAAGEVMKRPASKDFIDAKNGLKGLFDSVRDSVDKLRASTSIPAANGAMGPVTGSPISGVVAAVKESMAITTSLGKVGGGNFGGSFSPMITEQRRGNSLLSRIVANTSRLSQPAYAIV